MRYFVVRDNIIENIIEAPAGFTIAGADLHIATTAGSIGWSFMEGSPVVPPRDLPSIEETLADMDAACRKYIDRSAHWSGGILVERKANSGKLKAKAVSAWTESVWQEFYNRTARLAAGEPVDASFTDFTTIGPCPYTMAEIMVE
jgi:hypothetical protein